MPSLSRAAKPYASVRFAPARGSALWFRFGSRVRTIARVGGAADAACEPKRRIQGRLQCLRRSSARRVHRVVPRCWGQASEGACRHSAASLSSRAREHGGSRRSELVAPNESIIRCNAMIGGNNGIPGVQVAPAPRAPSVPLARTEDCDFQARSNPTRPMARYQRFSVQRTAGKSSDEGSTEGSVGRADPTPTSRLTHVGMRLPA